MKRKTLEMLVCPKCHGVLEIYSTEQHSEICYFGNLYCETCLLNYSIVDGIPDFLNRIELNGLNRRASQIYDRFSWGYGLFSKIAFAFIGMSEEIGRREITDRLEPLGGNVLEVSIGPGINLPYLVGRPDVGNVFGLDISKGQLTRCLRFAAWRGWDVELFLGNGELLPFRDNTFESVFHIGGINFFNDKESAICEMIRVAKPGARIIIADETEKGAQGYEKFIPGFKKSFGGLRDQIKPPVEMVPIAMQELRVYNVWKGWMYCIEFRKPGNLKISAGSNI